MAAALVADPMATGSVASQSMKHRGRRYCWLRFRFHKWSVKWLDGTIVNEERRKCPRSATYGCLECGATQG